MGDRDAILEAAKSRGFIKSRKPVMAYSDLPADMKREREADSQRWQEN